jgi:Helix-loop-helix DNA-binding domain
MASNSSLRSTPISPETPTLIESLDDAAVVQDGSDLQDTSRRDRGLRSTPQAPEPPKTGLSVTELIHHPGSIGSVLTPVQLQKLRSIPVSRYLQRQANYNAQMDSAPESCSISSDNSRSRKRKVSEADADDEDSENGKNVIHNRTEKRYRTNLNNQIAILRNCVPSLRSLSARSEYAVGGREDLQDLPPRRLSKV